MMLEIKSIGLMKGAKVRAKAVIIYGLKGWKASVWYCDDLSSTKSIGKGDDVYNAEDAEIMINNLSLSWRDLEIKLGRY